MLLTERYHRHLRMSDVQSQSSLRLFTPLSCPDTASHVIKLVRSASAKQFSLDPTPKWLLEDCIDLISPYLTRRRQEARPHQAPVTRSPPLASRRAARPVQAVSADARAKVRKNCRLKLIEYRDLVICKPVNKLFLIGCSGNYTRSKLGGAQ